MHNESSSNTSLTHFLCPSPRDNCSCIPIRNSKHTSIIPVSTRQSNTRHQTTANRSAKDRGVGSAQGTGELSDERVRGAHVRVDRRQNVNKLLKNCQTDQLNGNNKNHIKDSNTSVKSVGYTRLRNALRDKVEVEGILINASIILHAE